MRGAVSDGYQQIAEGFYNMLGSMLGRNPHSGTPTPDLRIQLRITEQKLAVEQAAMEARRKREPRSRGFATRRASRMRRADIRAVSLHALTSAATGSVGRSACSGRLL